MREIRRRLRVAAPLAAIAAASACGTTVHGIGSQVNTVIGPSGQAGTGGLNVPPPTGGSGIGSGAGTTVPGGGAGSLSGPTGGGLGTAPSAGGSSSGGGSTNPAGGGSGGRAAVPSGVAPGVTPTTITVGAAYVSNAAAGDAALGAAGLNPGNTQDEIKVFVHYLNTHGGIAHRQVKVVYFSGDATQPVQSQYSQACSKWTQDNKVFAFGVGDFAGGTPQFDQCAANAHAFNITSGGLALEDTSILQRFPQDILLTELTDDDSMRVTIAGLDRQGYFSGGAKVGIVTWDQSDFAYGISHVALPALARLGFRNVPVQAVSVPQSEGGLSSTSASISNAVLRFRTKGINHVLFFDGNAGVNGAGTLALLWMNDAETQHYRPRYGLNSASGLTALAPDVPAAQMVGSLAVGWSPVLDESASDYPTSAYSANGKLCLRIMTGGGEAPSTTNQKGSELGICDWFFYLKHVLDPIANPLTTSRALAAINASRNSYVPAVTFGLDITASRHDGVALVRNAAFVPSCTCYRYTSAPYRIG